LGALPVLSVGSSPYAAAKGDFNGDGVLDIVTTNFASNNVTVLLGADGTVFPTQNVYSVGTSPIGVAVADLNADGKLDIHRQREFLVRDQPPGSRRERPQR
jgi:hypothetical protein